MRWALVVLASAAAGHVAQALEWQNLTIVRWFEDDILRLGENHKVVTDEEQHLWSFLGIDGGSLCPIFEFEEYPYFFILLQLFTSMCSLAFAVFLQESLEGCWNRPHEFKAGEAVQARFYETSEHLGWAWVQKSNDDGTYQLEYMDTAQSFHAVPRKFLLNLQTADNDNLEHMEAVALQWGDFLNCNTAVQYAPPSPAPYRGFGEDTASTSAAYAYRGFGEDTSAGPVHVAAGPTGIDVGSYVTYSSVTDVDKVMQAETRRMQVEYGEVEQPPAEGDGLLAEGTQVRALVMKPSVRWYTAIITAKNANGVYQLKYSNGKTAEHVLREHIQVAAASQHTDPYLVLLDQYQDKMERQEEEEEEDAHVGGCGMSATSVPCSSFTSNVSALHTFRSWDDSSDKLLTVMSETIDHERAQREEHVRKLAMLATEKRALAITTLYWSWQLLMAAMDMVKFLRQAWSHARHARLGPWPTYNLFVYGYIHCSAFTTLLHGACALLLFKQEAEQQKKEFGYRFRRDYEDVSSMVRHRDRHVVVLTWVFGVLLMPLLPIAMTHSIPMFFIFTWPTILCFCIVVVGYTLRQWADAPFQASSGLVMFPPGHARNASADLKAEASIGRIKPVLILLALCSLIVLFQTLPSVATRVWAGEMSITDPFINDYQSRTWRSAVECKAGKLSSVLSNLLRWT